MVKQDSTRYSTVTVCAVCKQRSITSPEHEDEAYERMLVHERACRKNKAVLER